MGIYTRMYGDDDLELKKDENFSYLAKIFETLEREGVDGVWAEGFKSGDNRQKSLVIKLNSTAEKVLQISSQAYFKTNQRITIDEALIIAKYIQEYEAINHE